MNSPSRRSAGTLRMFRPPAVIVPKSLDDLDSISTRSPTTASVDNTPVPNVDRLLSPTVGISRRGSRSRTSPLIQVAWADEDPMDFQGQRRRRRVPQSILSLVCEPEVPLRLSTLSGVAGEDDTPTRGDSGAAARVEKVMSRRRKTLSGRSFSSTILRSM
eukprot:TRINITY_DN46257_c0_g1_i1.p1 TRINITY_DN46257_c0_g1~~TRINITY_DN46257_c0_g1_i1.p1  ORF type:complete len:160 (-),score=24.95 TRINITY_DN46257_c0_g1_i1:26-505(-)